MRTHDQKTILVTGATGYIGGRLVPRLLKAGYKVKCVVRSPRKLAAQPWINDPDVSVIECDASDKVLLTESLRGCYAGYYLIHSMIAAGKKYRERDRELAAIFAASAHEAGVERIIYLGGLGELGDGLSDHLKSRREVENELASTTVPVTVLRAAMIIGSGSASFEILRYLVERLPVMTTPKWVGTECQPISIRNVLHYLVACLENDQTAGMTLDIGGADILTYREIMQIMAEERGLPRRIIIPLPVLTPRLSAYWIHIVTPLSSSIALPLSDGLRNRVVCRNDDAHKMMPQQLLSIREAIREAVVEVESNTVETMWSDAGTIPGDPDWAGGTVFRDVRRIEIDASEDKVFGEIMKIGGKYGYWKTDWLWKIRGFWDHLIGGPGLLRGRRDKNTLAYGDAVDFWRVGEVSPDTTLILIAQMKLPGDASLEYHIAASEDQKNTSILTQTAKFKPRGLWGLAYWYSILPFHNYVFKRMILGIKQKVEHPDER